jgi:hypothetical protein
MRYLTTSFAAALSAAVALGMTASAYANGATGHDQRPAHARAHAKVAAKVAIRAHRHAHIRVHAKWPTAAYPYAYGYVPDYAYYVPTRVFRCYPARQMVEDQVGLVVGYVPLGTCG